MDGSVISAFQDTGDTEEIHLVNVKVSFHYLLNNPGIFQMFGLHIILEVHLPFRTYLKHFNSEMLLYKKLLFKTDSLICKFDMS